MRGGVTPGGSAEMPFRAIRANRSEVEVRMSLALRRGNSTRNPNRSTRRFSTDSVCRSRLDRVFAPFARSPMVGPTRSPGEGNGAWEGARSGPEGTDPGEPGLSADGTVGPDGPPAKVVWRPPASWPGPEIRPRLG